MKTRNLTGAALDWVVAKCEFIVVISNGTSSVSDIEGKRFSPSTDWAQGGSIIEREKISTTVDDSGVWVAYNKYNYAEEKRYMQTGATPLIAAMRCHVASQLGDEITLPQELTP